MAVALCTRRRRPGRTVYRVAAAVLAVTAAGLALGFHLTGDPEWRTVQVSFDGYRFGAVPTEFTFDPAGALGRPSWRVYTDPFAPSPPLVLVQAAPVLAPEQYAFAVLRDMSARDLSASVFIKPMGGAADISGGLAWQVKGGDTFHAAVADARSRQLRILSVAAGRVTLRATAPIPTDIEYERRSPTPSHGWFELRVEVSDEQVTAWFAGQQVVTLSNPAPARNGGVGLLTHGDSVVAFDSLSVRFH